MSKFYTHVSLGYDSIYYRGYDEDGIRVQEEVKDYNPSLFVLCSDSADTPYTTLDGRKVSRIQFESLAKAREFVKNTKSLSHDYYYGNTRYNYTYISDMFRGRVEYNPNLIRKATIDIETDSSNGFSSAQNPFAPIITITLKYRGTYYVYGLKPYKSPSKEIKYAQYPTEKEMLKAFIEFWHRIDIDVLYGWNTDGYDIPYIVNRCRKVLGEATTNKLSPWGKIQETKMNFRGKFFTGYDLVGITSLDYMDLYRRYRPKAESEKLAAIGEIELGETKVEYDGTLNDLYENDYDKFIFYNVTDVDLVDKLDDKLKLSDMVFATAYDSKCLYGDVQQQVRMWDAIMYNSLRDLNIAVPPIVEHLDDTKLPGAAVLPAQKRQHKWVVSFDFASLYPSIIMEHNISPDTLLGSLWNIIERDETAPKRADGLDEGLLIPDSQDLSAIKDRNLTCSSYGYIFTKEKTGILGTILDRMFAERKKYKKAMLEAKAAYEEAESEEERIRLKRQEIAFDVLQNAKKTQLNSAYGALGNKHFRYYDLRLAGSVTVSGRCVLLTVRDYIAKKIQEKYNTTIDPIIYGDTDSLYISAIPFVDGLSKGLGRDEIVELLDKEYCENILRPWIQEALTLYRDRFNTFSPRLTMARDIISTDAIFVSKKRYLMEVMDAEGVRYHKPKRKTMGLEMIKSTTPKFCKAWLHTAVDYILTKSESDLQSLVSNFRRELETIPLDQISHPINVSDIEKWLVEGDSNLGSRFNLSSEGTALKKGAPMQVKAAVAFNDFLESRKLTTKYDRIKSGMRMRLFHLKEQNPYKTDVMGMVDKVPEELQLQRWIDYEEQFEKLFVSPLNILLQAVDWRLVGQAPSVMSIFDE